MDALIKLPFQIIGVPLHWLLGKVGLVIAAIINAILLRQLLCILAWNLGWTWVGVGWLLIAMAVGFIMTFVSVKD